MLGCDAIQTLLKTWYALAVQVRLGLCGLAVPRIDLVEVERPRHISTSLTKRSHALMLLRDFATSTVISRAFALSLAVVTDSLGRVQILWWLLWHLEYVTIRHEHDTLPIYILR